MEDGIPIAQGTIDIDTGAMSLELRRIEGTVEGVVDIVIDDLADDPGLVLNYNPNALPCDPLATATDVLVSMPILELEGERPSATASEVVKTSPHRIFKVG